MTTSNNQAKFDKRTLVQLYLPVTAALILANVICFYTLVINAQRGSSSLKPNQEQQDQHQPPQVKTENIQAAKDYKLLLIATGNDLESEAFERFNRSVRSFKLNLVALDSDQLRDKTRYSNDIDPIDAFERKKFQEYKKALSNYKNDNNLVILLLDGESAIVNGQETTILSRFFGFETKLLIAADDVCWPDCSKSLAGGHYPKTGGSPYINSNAVIGYASALWEVLSIGDFAHEDKLVSSDDTLQTYLSKIYLDTDYRSRFGIKLDHKAAIIQTVHLDTADTQIKLDIGPDIARLRNLVYNTEPVIAIGSDANDVGSWITLNSLGNYLGQAWTPTDGCRDCNITELSLENVKDSDLPSVLVGVFIEEATPFIEDFFEKLVHQNYPQNKIHLFIHNPIKYHDQHVKTFLDNHGLKYASKQLIDSNDEREARTESQARNYALDRCVRLECDYYLSLDSVARLEWSNALRKLIETNRNVVAPLLNRPGKLWSTFWGAITPEGYYSRSHDYVDIVNGGRVGLWNMPHVMYTYLIKGSLLRKLQQTSDKLIKPKLSYALEDALVIDIKSSSTAILDQAVPVVRPPVSLVFSNSLRSAGVFQHLLNTHEFGHLVDPSHYNTSVKHPDFYQLSYNMEDWEEQYLHDKYMDIFDEHLAEFNLQKPCPDVSWFPLVNERFCREIIEIMEHYGQWSGGTNNDPRIEGGYESVPTRDIHMKQVGLHEMWLTFLKEYVMPVQMKEYIGYEHDPPRADLAFVVRYHPAEQASLRPHHDSSTYTLNIALNTPGVDYEGGGCRFIRYNCSVTQSRKGWALLHPGRLTHYHEGLPVTNGTRYIMVTFVDP